MKLLKKLALSFVSLAVCTGVVGCNNDSSSSSSAPKEMNYAENIQTNMIEGEDYIEHAKNIDSDGFIYDDSMWYVNDLTELPLPDPHIFVEEGTYYIVGTSDRSNGNVIDCYVTTDFNNYELLAGIYDPSKFKGWEANSAQIYAPEIYCFDGVYYMYYSAISKDGKRYNSVVKSDNPDGPYEPIVNDVIDGFNNPVFEYGQFDVLDATIFVDDDKQMYMYFAVSGANQHIVGVKMNSPYEADWSTYTELVFPGNLDSKNVLRPLSWEMLKYYQIAEAPYMIKSNGKYYLTYSVNGCWNKYYSVCYAVSDSPLGNFVKPYKKDQVWTNLLLGYSGTGIADSKVYQQWSGFASGTGHHCFFNIGNQTMIAYHAHQNRDWNSETSYTNRYFAIDYLYFDENGVPFCNGPTWSPQPLPEAISGYKNVAENAKVRVKNIENGDAINDNYIVDNYNLSQEDGKEVVLGKGYSWVELTFDKEYEIGGLAIYNSAYYDKAVYEINYVDFQDGNSFDEIEFASDMFINDETEFIFPNSAFTFEILKTIKTNKIVVCFNLPNGGQINEIKVLAK